MNIYRVNWIRQGRGLCGVAVANFEIEAIGQFHFSDMDGAVCAESIGVADESFTKPCIICDEE